jgi:hypothetical protein
MSSMSRPSAAAKPLSTATSSAAASHSGMNQLRGGDDGLGDLGDLAVLVHGGLAQERVGLLLGEVLGLHQDALGAVDHLALLERALGLLELSLQPVERVKARDAKVEYGFDALFLEPVDDVGGYAGVDGCLDRGRVRLIDKHRDRPLHDPAHLEHLFEHVTARVFEVDENDIGIEGVDASQKLGGAFDAHNVHIAGLAQAFFQDRGANRAVVDNDDVQGCIHRQAQWFKRCAKPANKRKLADFQDFA